MVAASLSETITSASTKQILCCVAISALTCHGVFKRWEPLHVLPVGTLLVGIPAVFSILLSHHHIPFLAFILSFTVYHATLLSSIVLYRLSPFHPYGQYPGPIPAKISMLWTAYIASGGKLHEYVAGLHEKYGDVVRVGPNEISVRDVSAIRPAMGAQGMPKGPMWAGLNYHEPGIPLIALRDPALHQVRRRPWNRAFSTLATKEYQPVIAKRAVQLVDRLSEQKEVVDLAQWFGFFTYDFMSDIVFGGGTEMVRDGDVDGLWQSLKDALSVQPVYEQIPWVTYYLKIIPGATDTQFREFCFDRGTKRYARGATVKDLFYYLSNEDGAEKENPSPSAVIGNSVLAVVAGSDTTSTVLSNLFFCVLRQLEYYKRLQQEVDCFYPTGEDATNPEHHSKMIFMEACINETLRLYPVVPSGSQRSPTPGKGGKVIGQHFIPEGHQVRIQTWSVHRDPRNFSYPTTFMPRRWLIAEGHEQSTETLVHNPNAFIPFSFGPANCVGKNMALLEMKILVCHLVQRLDLRFADGWDTAEWDRNIEERFVMRVGKLPVIVTPRL